MYTRLFRILYMAHPAGPRRARPRRRARDAAIDCDGDDREIAADDGRRCARGEARRPTDATEARATSRKFRRRARGRDANDGRERATGARTISKRVVD
jgi:hypothetical protein